VPSAEEVSAEGVSMGVVSTGVVSLAEVTGIQMLLVVLAVAIKVVDSRAGQFVTSGAHEVMVAI
jgi:hypothetical protein